MTIIVLILLIIILLILLYYFIIKPFFMSQSVIHRYHFSVDWGGERIGFMEVSGLNIEIEAVSLREGSSPVDSVRKIPGLRKFSDITLKRGIVKGDNEFFNWINTKQIGNIERRDVIISLLDESHNPIVRWKANNAFPVKYEGPTLESMSSDVAIEALILTHEGITVESV